MTIITRPADELQPWAESPWFADAVTTLAENGGAGIKQEMAQYGEIILSVPYVPTDLEASTAAEWREIVGTGSKGTNGRYRPAFDASKTCECGMALTVAGAKTCWCE